MIFPEMAAVSPMARTAAALTVAETSAGGKYADAATLLKSAGDNPQLQAAGKSFLQGAPLSERLHPQVPKSVEIKEALGRLTPEERLYILTLAKMLASYSKAVEEAVGSMK